MGRKLGASAQQCAGWKCTRGMIHANWSAQAAQLVRFDDNMHRPNRRTVLLQHCTHPMLQLNARSMQVKQVVERPETTGQFQFGREAHQSLLFFQRSFCSDAGIEAGAMSQRGRRSDTKEGIRGGGP